MERTLEEKADPLALVNRETRSHWTLQVMPTSPEPQVPPIFPCAPRSSGTTGGGGDAFVAKLSAAGALIYSTFIGGLAQDAANAIAVDAQGNAYIAGQTCSADFPLMDPVQTSIAGVWEAFVAKLTPSGTALSFSTYFGGGGNDAAAAIAVDALGRVYLAGQTQSNNLPTNNAIQASNGGTFGAFVASLATTPYCSGIGLSETVTSTTSGTLSAYAYGVHLADAVSFPTWSAVNGQDDLIWYPGVNQGNGTWKAEIDLSRHLPGNPNYGPFAVHAYLFGTSSSFCGAAGFTRLAPPAPTCSGVGPIGTVTSATSGTLDYYAYGVQNATSVYFPTWSTVNGQDDMIWYAGSNLGGGTWKASIDLAKHRTGNPDNGPFAIHAYLFGSSSAFCGATGFTRLPPPPPSCTGMGPQAVVTRATSGTLNFYAYGVQNTTAMNFAAWSNVNGQDDLIWYAGSSLGGGTWKASIDLAKHRPEKPDYGTFSVHAWMSGTTNTLCGGVGFTRQ